MRVGACQGECSSQVRDSSRIRCGRQEGRSLWYIVSFASSSAVTLKVSYFQISVTQVGTGQWTGTSNTYRTHQHTSLQATQQVLAVRDELIRGRHMQDDRIAT